jgi:hypothetical protein
VGPLYQRPLTIRQRALGSDHPDVATSQNNLASFYQGQRRTSDALPLVQQTIASGRTRLRIARPVLFDAQAR